MQLFLRFLPLLCAPLLVACSANVDVFGTGGGDGTSTQTTGAGPGSTTGNPTTSQGTTVSGSTTSVVSSSSTGGPCVGAPEDDMDLDGFSPNAGDCNDCDSTV